jgi:hypothetical protein
MTHDLETSLADYASSLDAVASPIVLDELRFRNGVADFDSEELVVNVGLTSTETISKRRARSALPIVLSLSVAAGLLVALVTIDRRTAEPDGQGTIAPALSSAPEALLPAPPVATETPAETPDSSTVPSESALDRETVLTQMRLALSQLESFRATTTIVQSPPDAEQTTRSNDVTLMANGRMWSESSDGQAWSSFDPSTGTARAAWGTENQEIVGWDNTVVLMIELGHIPVFAADQFAEATITNVVYDGRPAWKFVQIGEFQNELTPVISIETALVDHQTGLVVQRRSEQTEGESITFRESSLAELTTGVDLPSEFPGFFPEGAIVDRSGSPDGHRSVTFAQARTEFGQGAIAPESLQPGTQVSIETTRTSDATGAQTQETVALVVTLHSGFLTSRVVSSKNRLIAGSPRPDGTVEVDGFLCPYASSANETSCSESSVDPSSPIVAGALAGSPVNEVSSSLSFSRGVVWFTVEAPTPFDAIELANSLVELTPELADELDVVGG